MNSSDLEKRLLEAFSAEAEERLESLFTRLSELENATSEDQQQNIIEVVFREAHSLKGAARSVNLTAIEGLCQSMESIFGMMKNQSLEMTPNLFDTLHAAAEALEQYINAGDAQKEKAADKLQEFTKQLDSIHQEPPANDDPAKDDDNQGAAIESQAHSPDPQSEAERPHLETSVKADASASPQDSASDESDQSETISGNDSGVHRPLFSDTIRVSTNKLDALMLKVEELILIKQIAGQYQDHLTEILFDYESQKINPQRLSEEYAALSRLYNQTGEYGALLTLMNHIIENRRSAESRISSLLRTMEQGNRTISNKVDDLLEDMKKTTLMPFSTLFAILPRMVREIAKDRGKNAELFLSGGEIEIDKRILEQIKDPVFHLIRNAVDHGIETPEIRRRRNKPEKGRIQLKVAQLEGNRVELEISDDGGGMDLAAIKDKALKNGLISEKTLSQMTDTEILNIILTSGFSTSPLITEISGRGLGMAIVKDTVESFGGGLSVTHVPGKGATFTLYLPITQATFRGILVRCSEQSFIIPNAQVQHVLQVNPKNIQSLENRPAITIDGHTVGLVHLYAILGLAKPKPADRRHTKTNTPFYPVIVLGNEEHQIAFIVDDVLGELEVLVKNLGRQLGRINHIAGATVLGSGRVVPVLNPSDLIKSATGKASGLKPETIEEEPAVPRHSILVVEDSFTSRTLLKNILEASGYIVETAINGQDGYERLQNRNFDAVVTDVEMPQLNGFELTAKIREDERLSEMPVILVTSLDSRSDRERGVEVGADAYIIKSSFDQSNLLEVLEKLV